MAGEEDLRWLLDPLAVLRAARPKWRTVEEQTVIPEATPEVPDPEPIVTPEYTEVYVDAEDLPEEIAPEDEVGVSLGAKIALVAGALAQQTDKSALVAVGRVTRTSGLLLPGGTVNLSVTFDTEALAVPESGWVQIQASIAWLGKTYAVVVPGSITSTGCTVRVTALDTVVFTPSDFVTYEAVCLYTYAPPYDPEA